MSNPTPRETFATVGTAIVVPVCFVGMIVLSSSPLGWPFFFVFVGWFVLLACMRPRQ